MTEIKEYPNTHASEYRLYLTEQEFDMLSKSIDDCLEICTDNREHLSMGVLYSVKADLERAENERKSIQE